MRSSKARIVLREWEKVRTDLLTISSAVPPAAAMAAGA